MRIVTFIFALFAGFEAVAWIGGYREPRYFLHHPRDSYSYFECISDRGLFSIEYGFAKNADGVHFMNYWSDISAGRVQAEKDFFSIYRLETFYGFACGHTVYVDGPGSWASEVWELILPAWFTVGITAVPLGYMLLRSQVARRNKRRGLCAKCGYDLRASRERCPECGTAF